MKNALVVASALAFPRSLALARPVGRWLLGASCGLGLLVACGAESGDPALKSDEPLQPFGDSMTPASPVGTAAAPATGSDPGSAEPGGMGTGEAVDPSLPLGGAGSMPGVVPLPQSVPGVVVLLENGGQSCIALCTTVPNTVADPFSYDDNWSSENGNQCILPGTITARSNQPCNTGAALPAPRQVPGVVIVEAGVPRCAPLCAILTDLAQDPDADGWFFENNLSCVVAGSAAARANQSCTTGGALPDADPRPGLLIADGLDALCKPVCQVVTTPSSPDAPDWGYEQNTSCVLPNSVTASGGARQCTFGGPVDPLIPPALPGNKVAAGFFVQGGRLRDAYGADFVIRGVNNPHIWFDISAQYEAYLALDRIAGYGTNTIRVVWETSGSVRLLREVLHRIVELRMVPMVELHDATSSNSRAALLDMAAYYARADVRELLTDFREYLLVNIANEWSGNDFQAAYNEAIGYLRANGVSHTLVIDANGFGQNGQAILDNAAALTAADPQRNLLFSVHMYESFAASAAVDNLLNAASSAGIPLIVGEFGWQHGGRAVAWERILTRTNELRLGYIAWSWWGNGAETAQLDMANDWDGPLTDWGNDVMLGAPGSIQGTSQRASIFQ